MVVLFATSCIPGNGAVSGTVSFDTGQGAAGVAVQLFPNDLTPGRPAQRDTVTDAFGQFQFDTLEAGCFTLSYVAPPGYSAPDGALGSLPATKGFCLDQDQVLPGLDFTFVADERMASLGGRVSSISTGASEAFVLIDVYTADANGDRADFVGDTFTDGFGQFTFRVAPGCYRLTFQAPLGRTFPNGSDDGRFYQPLACVGVAESATDIDAFLD
jgi:hypothetical protein